VDGQKDTAGVGVCVCNIKSLSCPVVDFLFLALNDAIKVSPSCEF
jgi:hypothetical protein